MSYTAVAQYFNDWTPRIHNFRYDVLGFSLALLIHTPLFFVKLDQKKKAVDRPTSRLVSVDLIDQLAPLKPPPAPVVEKKKGLFDKIKQLVKKEPPPPPPKKVEPKQPAELKTDEAKIKLEPKLDVSKKIEPALAGKSGFKTKADPKLIEEKQISLKTIGTSIAPLSEKRLGAVDPAASVKSDRGDFKIAQDTSIKSIGGDKGPSISGAQDNTIAIRTGSKGSVEKFSAPVKSDKGKLGSVGTPDLGTSEKVGLRDYVIARDAKPGSIDLGDRGGVSGGVPGGVPGGVLSSKKDAGRFDSSGSPSLGTGIAGSGSTGSKIAKVQPIQAAPKVRKKESMFSITGPLKDRKIVKQVLPSYPAWAQAKGVEASVVLEFIVDPSGIVKDKVVVRRTSGYAQLDDDAIQALLQWRFVPLEGEEFRNEVGLITFNYSLR